MRWGNESPYLEALDFDSNSGKHIDRRSLLNADRTKWKKEGGRGDVGRQHTMLNSG